MEKKRKVAKNRYGHPRVKNLINQKYITNIPIWYMDATLIGDVWLFYVYDGTSKYVVSYAVICKPNELTAEHIAHCISLAIETMKDNGSNLPRIIHGDMDSKYDTKEVRSILDNAEIALSESNSKKNGNQEIESHHRVLKTHLAQIVIDDMPRKQLQDQQRGLPDKIRKQTFKQRRANKEYQQMLWNSPFFKQYSIDLTTRAIGVVNSKEHPLFKGSSTGEVHFFTTHVINENVELYNAPKGSIEAEAIVGINKSIVQKGKIQTTEENMPFDAGFNENLKNLKLPYPAAQAVATYQDLAALIFVGFTRTYEKTDELLEQNKYLQKQLDFVTTELSAQKQIRKNKEEARNKRKNRKASPKRDGIFIEDYRAILKLIGEEKNYTDTRLRLTMAILVVTGIRISELRFITMGKVTTFFATQRPHLRISRIKRGQAEKTAHLTPLGATLLKERQDDFKRLADLKKNKEDYIFSTQKRHDQPVSREHFTRSVNKILSAYGTSVDKVISSHSFRVGFITRLWQNTDDIELVRQVIGHTSILSTQTYIKDLSEERKAARIQSISPEKETSAN